MNRLSTFIQRPLSMWNRDKSQVHSHHLDLSADNGRAHLSRNKTERVRLQGLQRGLTVKARPSTPVEDMSVRQRWKLWMINEGSQRVFLIIWTFLHLLVLTLGFLNYQLNDSYTNARKTFGVGFAFARAASRVLLLDVALILLPVCRGLISLCRRTPLNGFIPFDKNLLFHKATGWSLVVFSAVHIIAHLSNFGHLAAADPTRTTAQKAGKFLALHFASGTGLTGWIMTAVLGFMVWFAMEKRRRANFERFWYSHHLFIVFFVCWQIHGMFCMIKPDRPPYCSRMHSGVFWQYWLLGGALYTYERILREVRARERTTISKVIQHPSNVVEIQIKKDFVKARAGQYIFINVPSVSRFQWHPFTLTSAPEEDFLSIHMRAVGDFTKAVAHELGCTLEESSRTAASSSATLVDASSKRMTKDGKRLDRTLPRIMVDGPFGSASEDFLNYEVVTLVGAGIGVTPFASILKSIWYRMNDFGKVKRTRLTKVYFIWVIRDFGSAEWFHSLLQAIEEQPGTEGRIEIHIYLTAKLKVEDMHNIMVEDVGAEKDAVTRLRAPTHYGRPKWDSLFQAIGDQHPKTDVGVFFCGPAVLSKELHLMCNKHSQPDGTRFFYGKENF